MQKEVTVRELAAMVGDAAALMVFAQEGANVGRTFDLRRIDGRGRIKVKVCASKVMVEVG